MPQGQNTLNKNQQNISRKQFSYIHLKNSVSTGLLNYTFENLS